MSLIRYVYLPLVAKPLKLNIPPELGPQYRQSRSALPLSSAWPAVGSPPAVAGLGIMGLRLTTGFKLNMGPCKRHVDTDFLKPDLRATCIGVECVYLYNSMTHPAKLREVWLGISINTWG